MLRICKKILTLQKFTDTMPKGDTDDIKSMSKAENWKVVWSVQFIFFFCIVKFDFCVIIKTPSNVQNCHEVN